MFSQNEKSPLYWQLAEMINDKIESGELQKGDKIPSERELCEIYGLSRITIRNAINELVKQNKLEKIQGKGTFVLGKSITQKLNGIYSFSQEMEKQGEISSTVLIKKEEIKADAYLAEQLQIPQSDPVIFIERLRCADDYPIMLERTYFSKQDYSFILDIDFSKRPLYTTLENKYGIKIDKAVETFKPIELDAYVTELLGAQNRNYGLLVKRVSYSKDNIVSYSTIVSKGDVFEFTVTLE